MPPVDHLLRVSPGGLPQPAGPQDLVQGDDEYNHTLSSGSSGHPAPKGRGGTRDLGVRGDFMVCFYSNRFLKIIY